MEPIVAPFMPEVGFALGDLVGMVREGVVDAAAMDIELFAEVFHGDAGAFDVPAGIADAPGTVPFEFLILEFGFGEPQHEVGFIALVIVFFHAFAHAVLQVVLGKVIEDVILL